MKVVSRSECPASVISGCPDLDNISFEDEQSHNANATDCLFCLLFGIGTIVTHGFEMKTSIFSLTRMRFAVLLLWLFALDDLHARILNGYGAHVVEHKQQLENLRLTLLGNNNLPSSQRKQLKAKIAALIDFIALHEITEEAIRQLKVVSPKIFQVSDRLRDKLGRPTDVYIKLVRRERSRLPLEGANFLWQHAYDKDLTVSEFGNQTATIEVWLGSNALLLLSHELGHVTYIVPNLATYVDFYKHAYWGVADIHYVGHEHQDRSGKSANNFMKQYYADLREYRRLGGIKLKSPLLQMAAIKKQLKNEMGRWENLAFRSQPVAPLDAH